MKGPPVVQAGQRIKLLWEEARGWFQGTLAAGDPDSQFPWRVEYDDGDVELVSFLSATQLAAQHVEDGTEQTRQRQFKLLSSASPAAAPAKCKRGRARGAGKKAGAAEAAAGAAGDEAEQQEGGEVAAAAAAEGEEQQEQAEAGSPAKKPRRQQRRAAAASAVPAAQLAEPAESEGRAVEVKPTSSEGLAELAQPPQAAAAGVETAAQPAASPPPTAQQQQQQQQQQQADQQPPGDLPPAATPGEQPGPAVPSSTAGPAAGTALPAAAPGDGTTLPTQQSAAASGGGSAPLAVNTAPIPAANGALASDGGKKAEGAAAAGASPRAAAAAGPQAKAARDPRRAAAAGAKSSSATPAGRSMAPQPQAQLADQLAAPLGRAQATPGPPSVTTIGSLAIPDLTPLAGVTPRQDGSGALTPASALGSATPGSVRRSGVEQGVGGGASLPAPATTPVAEETSSRGSGEEEQFAAMLVGLTRTRESIARATKLALVAAKNGAGPRVVRRVLDTISSEDSTNQRVNLLYLMDSILQTSVHKSNKRDDCGPDSLAGKVYPRAVGAALSKLVDAVARDGQATEKLEKVLLIWQRKAIIGETLLQPALLQARTKKAMHESAWGDGGAEPQPPAAAGARQAAAAGERAASRGSGGQPLRGPRQPAPPADWPADAAGLWREWAAMDMNSCVLFKFIDQKTGDVLQLSQPPVRPWEDMTALRAELEARGVVLASPPRDEVLESGTSSWDEESTLLVDGIPQPDASPWHWASIRAAQRQAEAARREAESAEAAAAAAQWAQLAQARQAAAAAAGGGWAEPDEFDQEMLAQMAGSGALPAVRAQQQQQQADAWAQLSIMEGEGLYGGPPWPFAVGAGPGSLPPLPSEPHPDDEDDFADGPPPLPPYSPPHDEYAWDGDSFDANPPLPPLPPPDDGEGGDYEPTDTAGQSPDGPPPLPPNPPPDDDEEGPPAPLLPPGIGVPLLPPGIGLRQPRSAADLAAAPSAERADHGLPPSQLPLYEQHQPPLPPPPAAVALQLGQGPRPMVPAVRPPTMPPPLAAQPCTLRNWTGFVSAVGQDGGGIVDGGGSESAVFGVEALRGVAVLQVGDRVRCEGEALAEGQAGPHKWRVTSIRSDTDSEDALMGDAEGTDAAAAGAGGQPFTGVQPGQAGAGPMRRAGSNGVLPLQQQHPWQQQQQLLGVAQAYPGATAGAAGAAGMQGMPPGFGLAPMQPRPLLPQQLPWQAQQQQWAPAGLAAGLAPPYAAAAAAVPQQQQQAPTAPWQEQQPQQPSQEQEEDAFWMAH